MNIRGTKIVKAEWKTSSLLECFSEAHPVLGEAKDSETRAHTERFWVE